MGLEFFAGSGKVIGSGFESTKGGAFGCCWCMGLELLSDESDQWCMKSTCLSCFVRYRCALRGMEGFGDRIQVEAPVANRGKD